VPNTHTAADAHALQLQLGQHTVSTDSDVTLQTIYKTKAN